MKLKINMISESEFGIKGHGVHTAYLELTRALAAREDTDVIVNKFRRGADVTHIQTVGAYSLLHLLFGSGKKVVSAHVVPDSFIGSIAMAKQWRPLGVWWLKFFYGRADTVLAVSGSVATILEKELKVDPKKIKVFYNTIDMSGYKTTPADRRKARKVLGIGDTQMVVLGNGQVQPRKRVDIMEAMAREFPAASFMWVGGIPFKHMAAEYSDMKKLMSNVPPNMIVTGIIPLEKVKTYLQAADIFVLPAMQENHPMCVLEAAGAGLPIVLRDIPEYADTFSRDARYAENDSDFLTIIGQLLGSKVQRDSAHRATRAIAKRFDSTRGAEQAISTYRSLNR